MRDALIMRAPRYSLRGVPMPKLNQIVAIEKSVKSRVYGEITEMHKLSQKPDLFSGFSKQYRKKDEEGEDYPPEQKRVQILADEQLASAARLLKDNIPSTLSPSFPGRTSRQLLQGSR